MRDIDPARWIKQIPAYIPGRSKDEIAARYGIASPIKLASNENPLGPSPAAIKALQDCASDMHLYPDVMATDLRKAAAELWQCDSDLIIAGNGSDEIIDMLCRAYLEPGQTIMVPEHTFSYYAIAAMACGATVTTVPMNEHYICTGHLLEQAVAQQPRIIFIANPNNPTGTYIRDRKLMDFIQACPDETLIVIDEAYADFTREPDFQSAVPLVENHANLAVIKTLSKSHGLAGLRVGFGITGQTVMDNISRIKPPFNVNAAAIKAGTAALMDHDFLRQTLETTWSGLDFYYHEFERIGLEYVKSQTNFVLVRIGPRAKEIYERLIERGVITRHINCGMLSDYLRISIGLPEENRTLIEALEAALADQEINQ